MPDNYLSVSTRSLIDQVARQRGYDPATWDATEEELQRVAQILDQKLDWAWGFALWPQLTLCLRATYRPAWIPGTSYAEGEQVYRALPDGTPAYWEATAATAGADPATAGSPWRRCEERMLCEIDYGRYGVDEMDLGAGAYAASPDLVADAQPLPCVRTARGCAVQRGPGAPFCAKPWIRFRPLRPRLTARPWAAETPYAIGDLALAADGETYAALEANTATEPAAHPATWGVQRVPRIFEAYLVQAAAAEFAQDEDGRAGQLSRAEETLAALQRRCAGQIRARARVHVRVGGGGRGW